VKKIGIVGGVAWLSTVDYYSEICRRGERWHLARDRPGPPSTPEMTIESLDLNKAVAHLGVDGDEESWSQFDEYHRAALKRLEASGADFAIIASNTPHHRLDSIARGVGIPIVSIFAAAAKEGARIGASQVLILGTALTMSSQKFREEFAEYGIEAASPEDQSIRSATARLIGDLQQGNLEGAAERLGNIAKAPRGTQFAASATVCLACTELPFAFPALKTLPTFAVDGVSYINTTAAHIDAAFDFAVERTG